MSVLKSDIHPLLIKERVEALHQKQIYTVLDFLKSDIQQIIRITRLNFREVLAIRHSLFRKFSAVPINGFDYYKITLNNASIISTGIKGVDHLLNGGLLSGNIYEICGLPLAGKTTFVMSIIKNVVLNTPQHVYLFDSKSDFSGLKIMNMIKVYNEGQLFNCLERIKVTRTYTKNDLINSLYGVKAYLKSNKKLRLIIIDSLPSILQNSNNYAANNAFLNHFVNIIRYIATELHIALLITNVITTWSGNEIHQDTLENVACGRYWFGVPNIRMKIEKMESSAFFNVTVLNKDITVDQSSNSASIRITNGVFL